MRLIQNALGAGASRLFRNQVGAYTTADGRFIAYGLHPGSSDLIGWTTVEHAGRRFAVFTAIEVKSASGRVTPEQQRFIDAVRRAGGFAGVARNVGEATTIIHSTGTYDSEQQQRDGAR